MDERPATTARRVLHALADLSPAAEQRTPALAVPTEWFRWLPLSAVGLLQPPVVGNDRVPTVGIDRRFAERLAAVDQIRPGQRSLRMGWLFVAGRTSTGGGRSYRVFHPLVTIPVRVNRMLGTLVPAGDAEVSELVADRELRRELEAAVEFGGGALEGVNGVAIPPGLLARLDRLKRFARTAAAATELPASQIVAAGDGPDALMRSDELVIVAGAGVYATHETGGTSRAASLRAWTEEALRDMTAFHRLYLDDLPEPPPPPDDEPAAVESPFLLTPVQRDAVRSSRHRPLTLVSGAPGTGKSQTVVAIACDALARGQRVLVAAKSDATVDALLDLLERAPGPDPVVFGSNERRDELAARLSAGQLEPVAEGRVAEAHDAMAKAVDRRDRLRAGIADRLRAEEMLATPEDEVEEARVTAPALFDPPTDLTAAAAFLGAASVRPSGWLARRRVRKAGRRLRSLAGAGPEVPVTRLAQALDVARAARIAADLVAAGGLDLADEWDALRVADDEARLALGRWLAADSRSSERVNRSTLPAVAALATALRSGRSARRAQLARLNDAKLTRALPLWVGTLADVDDLLPPVGGLFDLVILDEASSIDQPLAAVTLLRGRRAVIAGDPHQLRHVSFLSDDRLHEVTAAHGLDETPTLAARLDVRRNSTFDIAAAAVPALTLGEHFRSAPHLMEFVARRLYDGRVDIATRMPATESTDCVRLVRMSGARDEAGVVREEVDRDGRRAADAAATRGAQRRRRDPVSGPG